MSIYLEVTIELYYIVVLEGGQQGLQLEQKEALIGVTVVGPIRESGLILELF